MKLFITNMIITMEEDRDKIFLFGPLKDKVQVPRRSMKNKDYYCSKYNLNLICKEPYYLKDKFSLIIKEETLTDYAERLLYLLNLLETSASQLIHNKTYDLETLIKLYTEDSQHETDALDCKINNKDYEETINQLYLADPLFTKALLTLKDIRWIGESIRNELFHSDHCTREIIHHAIIAGQTHQKLHQGSLKPSLEHRLYNQSADAVYWNFGDAIKSLATAIDITVSFLFYINSLTSKKRTKVQHLIYKDFKCLFRKSRDTLSYPHANLEQLGELNKELFLIRNELTHNQQVGSIRQPIFLGIGTPHINNLNLSYIDILLWDFENGNLCRSGGRCSFFKQKRNALLGIKTYANLAVEFINATLINCFFTIRKKLIESSVTKISIPTNYSKKDLGIKTINLEPANKTYS